MHKNDLISAIAEDSGLSKVHVGKVINSFIETVKKNVKDESINLIGFGKFETRHQKARTGKSPKDGSSIKIAARNKVAFVPGKALKEAVQ